MCENRNSEIVLTTDIGLNAVKLMNNKICMLPRRVIVRLRSATGWRETVVALLWQRNPK